MKEIKKMSRKTQTAYQTCMSCDFRLIRVNLHYIYLRQIISS